MVSCKLLTLFTVPEIRPTLFLQVARCKKSTKTFLLMRVPATFYVSNSRQSRVQNKHQMHRLPCFSQTVNRRAGVTSDVKELSIIIALYCQLLISFINEKINLTITIKIAEHVAILIFTNSLLSLYQVHVPNHRSSPYRKL